ncbi:WD40 repeat-like protein [Cucurbitaria berberidis CBS 394.84]|uniref:WD40 repeat-like protein n=1 Tax=Cucurbitaria berberidis CBS 394.84 TaxID=1168544 RepID=A0A9P4GFT4_9PLEO|nr:WD40 repeat-like protein [Cucurbitaria berberidis CBS 394.84]KAF1844649.1 WD40 repeat-like protein [Cucurbitaria berberidis CBS 394.84]
MSLSDWRQSFIDLTNDSDDDDDDGLLSSLPVATMAPTRASVPLPISVTSSYTSTPAIRPTVNHVPIPGSTPQTPSIHTSVSMVGKQLPNNSVTPPTSSSRHTPASIGRNGAAVATNYVPMPGSTQHSTHPGLSSAERTPKRMRVSAPNGPASPLRGVQHPAQATTTRANATNGQSVVDPRAQEHPHAHSKMERRTYHPISLNSSRSTEAKEAMTQGPPLERPARSTMNRSDIARELFLSKSSYFSSSIALGDKKKDSVMSDRPPKPELGFQQSTPGPTPTAQPSKPSSGRPKLANQFTTEQDHYLIFLKEVRLYSWKQITAEFNAEFPGRQYSTLQSRYATNLNKRDRSQDPAVLRLPSRFAAEAAVDWATVHGNHPGPRARLEPASPRQDIAATQPLPIYQTTEQDYSSGADSAPRRERSHRAKRVNYTWPRSHLRVARTGEDADEDEEVFESLADTDAPSRSETPTEEVISVPDTAVPVENEPMSMSYDCDDAKLALNAQKGPAGLTQKLPYLSSSQRIAIQDTHTDWNWDQLSSRYWQGAVLHVDFTPKELGVVEKAVAKMIRLAQESKHTARQGHARATLANLPESKLLQLIDDIRRRLPSRDTSSITAFLQDAKAGRIPDAPQVQRLAAARPQDKMSTTQKLSTYTIMRQRELGQHAKRGWTAASRPVTYQIKNKYMDSLGPAFSWTGASSDVHTVVWAPDGECFAAGAVAVDDPDSMQYNRPNNLLYGNTSDGLIHELGEHNRKREKTETGANSTHAMFVSQDPKLYTTVSSVAFAPSGRVMYSAGYDETICAWYTKTDSEQPVLGAKFRCRAQIDIMTVNRNHGGVLATAAKSTESKAVRLLTLNEEDLSICGKHSFHSSKAVSRSDLKILPTSLQFEPAFGGLLLAGFGANVRDHGFDTTGDLCLWDVETQTQLPIYGSNRNVFDVEFNPNRSYMPLFAVGCVAGANVNRGTRSVLRLYNEKVDKLWCPLEIECKALDINDVVWCPYDEHLIAAGCTDGRAYVWDLRWPTDPIRTLSHGRSLMPLQGGVPHEVTDTGMRFLSWGENATRLYSGSTDGVVKVWDVTRSEENTFIKDLITADSGIMSGAFSPDKSKLIIGEINGSVNVLEVGRDDCSIKDVAKLRFVPYYDEEPDQDSVTGEPQAPAGADSGIVEGNYLLQSSQVQLAPLGGLPIRQVVQGPRYAGPFDSSVDAPFLRQQALEFQFSLAAKPGPQCNIAACKASIVKVTSEEIGDSGRSADRISDELRQQRKAIEINHGIIPGKSKCTYCSRPARLSTTDPDAPILCERCSFACFRCGATNPVAAVTTTLICHSCAGVWDIGALGYECVQQPKTVGTSTGAPSLRTFGREAYLERLADVDTSFGDDMNALTDYYHSLAIDRPESPPL